MAPHDSFTGLGSGMPNRHAAPAVEPVRHFEAPRRPGTGSGTISGERYRDLKYSKNGVD